MRSQLDRALERQRASNTPIDMKQKLLSMILRAVNARAGGVIQNAVGAAVGWLTAWLLGRGIALPEDLRTQLEVTLATLGMFAVTTVVQWIQAKANKEVQAALNVEQDGWVGPQTVKRAEQIAETYAKVRP
jgi:hypothetical protein